MWLYLTTPLGAFVQEMIPFPSFLIFLPAGVSLQTQGAPLWELILLALIVGVARVLAGLILYGVSEKLYTYLYAEREVWLGVRRSHLIRLRKRLGENGRWWSVFGLWAIPVVPSILIPLSAGFVRIPLRTFITATYAGSIVNTLTYLCVGYYGLQGIMLLN